MSTDVGSRPCRPARDGVGTRSRVHVCRASSRAAHQSQVIAVVDRLRPDTGVMDVRMGEATGVAAGQRLSEVHRKVRVVVLSVHCDPAPRQQAGHALTWR
jgi:DNA-binding NarL/FixJ family response regulator